MQATIKLDKIASISIYVAECKKTVAQVKAETGADYILNGGLYTMATSKPCMDLRVAGKTLSQVARNVAGFGFDGNRIELTADKMKYPNFINCVELLKNKTDVKLSYDTALGGRRGRSAIGITADSLVLWCGKDGSTAARTPEKLQEEMRSLGCVDAIMLDGGGSSSCDFAGQRVTSSRKVHNYICVKLQRNDERNEPEGGTGMTIKVYSRAKDGNKKLSANFCVKEFACSDGTDPVFISDELVSVLQKIRTHFGRPVTINSAYRTATHNKKVGGATYSQHMYGTAADISIKGVTSKAIAAYAETILPTSGGIGIYGSFCHIDVRATRSRWNG